MRDADSCAARIGGQAVIRSAHSILRTDDLCAIASLEFGIPASSGCQLQRSFINDVYRLDTDGEVWFLRVSPVGWRTIDEVNAEIRFIVELKRAGAPVAQALPMLNGSGYALQLSSPEGSRIAVLFSGAAGVEPNFSNDPDALTLAHRYGSASAKLHSISDRLPVIGGRPPLDLREILVRPLDIVATQIEQEDRHYLADMGKRLAITLSGKSLTTGFAHGDLNSGNILFSDDGETIIDFDCCGWGFRANDIAGFARGVTHSRLPGADASALISAHLSAYAEVAPIASEDAAAIPAFLIVQRLWMASLHFDRVNRFGLASFGPVYASRLMVWLRAWDGVLEERPDWIEPLLR